MIRPSINLSPVERAARVAVGLTAVVAGLVLLLGGTGVALGVLAALLALTGVDLLVTGALGHCPLYARLGRPTRTPGSPA
jgi:hypothetical protein